MGWFDEEENNSSLVAARLATDAADVKSVMAERTSVILQNMTSLLTSFIVAFIIEWRVSLLILAIFPLLVLANFAQVSPLSPPLRTVDSRFHRCKCTFVTVGLMDPRPLHVFFRDSIVGISYGSTQLHGSNEPKPRCSSRATSYMLVLHLGCSRLVRTKIHKIERNCISEELLLLIYHYMRHIRM